RRNDEQQLVAQRAEADLLDDRQLAARGEPGDVARRDGRVVDHDARRLHAGPTGGGTDVVDGRRGDAGDRRDVVEQGGETSSHRGYLVQQGGSRTRHTLLNAPGVCRAHATAYPSRSGALSSGARAPWP